MDMHQAGHEAEWAGIKAGQLTFWQRIARHTNGYITPGNIISLMGLCLVLYGLLVFTQQQYAYSFVLVGLGRLADVLDGMVAHRTGTKSPLGEALDAGIDKIELVAAVAALAAAQAIPLGLLAVVVAINVCIALVSTLARLRRVALHPVRTGKLATFMLWISLGLYIGYAAFNVRIMEIVGGVCLLAAALMSVVALCKYSRHSFSMPTAQENNE